jgi:hypothetical protein
LCCGAKVENSIQFSVFSVQILVFSPDSSGLVFQFQLLTQNLSEFGIWNFRSEKLGHFQEIIFLLSTCIFFFFKGKKKKDTASIRAKDQF